MRFLRSPRRSSDDAAGGVAGAQRAVDHHPRQRSWATAGLTVALASVGIWLWSAVSQRIPGAAVESVRVLAPTLLLAVAAGGLVTALLWVVQRRWLRGASRTYVWCFVMSLLLLVFGGGPTLVGWALLVLFILVVGSVIGYQGAEVVRGRSSRGVRLSRGIVLGVTVALVAATATWLFLPGGRVPTPDTRNPAAERLTATDPSADGPFPVEELDYGSGDDRQRDRYGAARVSLRTTSVDDTAIVAGWSGGSGAARTAYWGFDASRLPLNAHVWSPVGPGKFPLVLIVHGNKSDVPEAEIGYAYLARTLASHGFIVASIDENFLNPGLLDRSGGIQGADPARAWLLLEHLRQWEAWSRGQGDGRFSGRVDMDAIALIGHSRGGEAVVTAAVFNRLRAYPDNPALTFNYNFGIGSVVALAPAEGQYRPGGQPLVLDGANYLTIQGAQDADVVTFGGLNQYARTVLRSDGALVKAAVKVAGANHTQFNTAWGRYDVGQGLPRQFINTGALMPPGDQQQVARTFVGAFLLLTLKGQNVYAPVFQDGSHAAGWLPAGAYENQVAMSSTRYAELAETGPIPLRSGPGEQRAVRIDGAGTVTATLPAAGGRGGDSAALVLDIGTSAGAVRGDLMVTDAAGRTATVPLDRYATLLGAMNGTYLKSGRLQPSATTEVMLRTVRVPLDDLRAVAPGLDLAQRFDVSVTLRAERGTAVYVANIGAAAR